MTTGGARYVESNWKRTIETSLTTDRTHLQLVIKIMASLSAMGVVPYSCLQSQGWSLEKIKC